MERGVKPLLAVYRRAADRFAEFPFAFERRTSGYSIACPMCGRRSRLNPATHRIHVIFGKTCVDRPIGCPNLACGWYVNVWLGVASDVPPRKMSAGIARDEPESLFLF
jgi:hypothetical protein